MKHSSIVLIATIILSTIVFQGCVDQNKEIKLVTAPLNTLGFKSNELPEGITKQNESFNDTKIPVVFSSNLTVTYLETYWAEYIDNYSNIYFSYEMRKISSIDEAEKLYELEKEDLVNSMFETYSINQLGDESITVYLRDNYKILFRKNNVISTTNPIAGYNFSINDFIELTGILVDHIESSM